MLLAHDDRLFPYRRRLLIASVCTLALASILIPLDGYAQRAYACGKVLLASALAYAFVVVTLEFLAVFALRFTRFWALFCYYVGILGFIFSPLNAAFGAGTKFGGWTAFTSSIFYSEVAPRIAAGFCAAAAAFRWLNAHTPTNDSLDQVNR